MGYQFGFLLKLLVLRSIERPAGKPARTFRGQCRNVGSNVGRIRTSNRSTVASIVAAAEESTNADLVFRGDVGRSRHDSD